MSDSLEGLVKKIKNGEDVSNIVNENNKKGVDEKSKPPKNSRKIANNSFESLMRNADRLDNYDNDYRKYHGIGKDKIKGYDPNKPFQPVGTSFFGLVKVLVIFYIGIYIISKF